MSFVEVKAAFEVDETGVIEGVAWPFGGPDRVGDVIEKGAFVNVRAPIPMLAFHNQGEPVGKWEEITETEEGLIVKGRLLVNEVARAKELHALIREKAVGGLSIGFATQKSAPRTGGGRTIAALDLLEISLVAVPAHPGARITASKEFAMNETTQTPDISALEAKMTDLEKKADTSALAARLDKIEAKMNRPQAEAPTQPSDQKAAFVEYLRSAKIDSKALTTASDTASHVLAPEEIEAEFIRNLVEFSPIRQIADVRSTTAPKLIVPMRTGVTNAAWVGETDTRTGSEPTFDQGSIDIKELATFVDISLQLAEDSNNVLNEVNLALAEDFGQKESLAFVNGATALEPSGFMANPDILGFDNGNIGAVDPDALISLMYDMPATYRASGTWVMNGATLAEIRKLKDGDGRYLWQASYQAGQPETILGRPVIEAVDMPDIAEDATPVIFGDFGRGYRIYDRLSLQVMADPYSQRVNGLMRYHARRRVGAGVVRPAAFRKLTMAL